MDPPAPCPDQAGAIGRARARSLFGPGDMIEISVVQGPRGILTVHETGETHGRTTL